MMLFGYEQGVFGGIIVGQDFIEYFNHPSPAMQGFVTSVYDLGCFVGAIITLFVGEKLGRRWTMLVFTVIMGSGIIFQTASHNMTQMVGQNPHALQIKVIINACTGLGSFYRWNRQWGKHRKDP